jgi:hypothetical protein
MQYADEIDASVMIYIPSSVKTGSGTVKLMVGGGIYRRT